MTSAPWNNTGNLYPQFNSMNGWGYTNPMPTGTSSPDVPSFTAQPEFMGPASDLANPVDPGMFAGMSNWAKNSGVLGSIDSKGIQSQGWGGLALGAASGIASAYMGLQQYGLAKDQLAASKRQFQLNYDAQKTTTNSALEDRQRARVASNSGAYQSVGDYMKQNGIK